MPPENAPAPLVTRRGLTMAGIALGVVAAAVVGFGLTTRKLAEARLSQWTKDQAVPTVAIAKPDTQARVDSIDLPGRLEAYSQAILADLRAAATIAGE